MDNFRKPPKRFHGRHGLEAVSGSRQHRANSLLPKANPLGSGSGQLSDIRPTDGFQAAQPAIRSSSWDDDFHKKSSSMDLDLSDSNTSRRAKTRRHRSKRRLVLKAFLVLFMAGLLTTGYVFGKAYLKSRNIFRGGGGAIALEPNVDASKLNGEGDGRVNILLLGKGGEEHTAPNLTDTILIASIDPIQKNAALLSIPRDLYVKPEGFGYMKINSVYARSKEQVLNGKKITNQSTVAEDTGLAAIEKTVEDTIGIPINYRVLIDFEAFRKAVDTVGGVTIDVKEQLYDPSVAWENNNNPLIAATGLQTMDGKKALLFSRSRHGSARGDFDRSDRQRQVLLALKEKVLSASTYANPIKISQLIDAFGNHVQTNLKVGEMRRLYDIGKTIDSNKVASIGLADPPNNYVMTAGIDGQSVVIPKAGQGDYSEIQNYIRNAMRDGFLQKDNANITVLNGTNIAGLAAKKASELKSFGYGIGEVADSPLKNVEKTIIVDMKNGQLEYTKRYLEKRFGVTVTTQLPDNRIDPKTADFVIILGTDAQTTR